MTEHDLVEMARLVPGAPHRPDPDDVIMPPDVREALEAAAVTGVDVLGERVRDLIDRARKRLPEGLLADFEAGVRAVERGARERMERLGRGEREPIVVGPETLAALVRLGWVEPEPELAPARPLEEPKIPGVPGNRRERRARAAQRRRRA